MAEIKLAGKVTWGKPSEGQCVAIQGSRRTRREEYPRTSSAKHVSAGELPHAREELSKTSTENSHPNDHVWLGDSACPSIEQREDECRGCEGEEAAAKSSYNRSLR
jgi:hypothetical protein